MSERTSEDHPRDRWSDRYTGWKRIPAWFWHHKLYRDIWLIIITVVLWGAVQANTDRVSDINQNRVRATAYSCQKFNDVVAAQNAQFKLIQAQIVSSSALPGDVIDPKGEKDPLQWKDIHAGPLSMQIGQNFPGFPTAEERFQNAKARAGAIGDAAVQTRNCKAEVASVQKSG
jgi:hypothetical protein